MKCFATIRFHNFSLEVVANQIPTFFDGQLTAEGCRTNTYNSTICTYKLIEGVYTTTEPRIPIKI